MVYPGQGGIEMTDEEVQSLINQAMQNIEIKVEHRQYAFCGPVHSEIILKYNGKVISSKRIDD